MTMSSKICNKITLISGFAILFLIFQPFAFADLKTASFDSPFTLKIGETAKIGSDIEITLLKVPEDSRCPSEVVCIWEGTVSAEVKVAKNSQDLGNHLISFVITESDEQTFDGNFIKLVKVEPYPSSTKLITPSEYSVTFLVSKVENSSLDSPLKQFNAGIPSNEIQCKDTLVLVIKSSNFRPACVTPNTFEKLIVRGWEKPVLVPSLVHPTIKTGTNSGHCIGYCFKEFIITPEKVVYSQNGREFVLDEWSDLPEKIKQVPITQREWVELVDLVDFQQFNSLPDKIGCPGCADAPVEWIEISYDGKTKKIEFEYEDKIPEITNLIVALQEIRNRVVIDSFEECIAAGNPAMESHPRQCRTVDGKHFVEEIDDVKETIPGVKGKRSPVIVPDATNENDLLCQTRWIIDTNKDLNMEHIKNSVQSTIAQFGMTYFLEEREITVSESTSGYVISISGLWEPESVQYSMITEDLENISGVEVQGEPAICV